MRASQRHYPPRGCKGRAASPSVGAPSIGAHTQRHLRCAHHLLRTVSDSESLRVPRDLANFPRKIPSLPTGSLDYMYRSPCVSTVFLFARREASSVDHARVGSS